MLYAVVKLCGQKYIVSPHCVHLCLIFLCVMVCFPLVWSINDTTLHMIKMFSYFAKAMWTPVSPDTWFVLGLFFSANRNLNVLRYVDVSHSSDPTVQGKTSPIFAA